ncbi:hypothetical protein [Nocardioides sp.]|uniref:hypothetical protein n=1 Tax=Nocardioides sp. TaxID=35761 RepID=UPI002735B5F2|nr:hypothetical protein [Nocardioides sp.]MDP3892755.1 hypothetical protein [Nocardioides sp.]
MDYEGTFDRTTWQALTVVVTLAALLATVVIWKRRGVVAGLRTLAVAMLPVAAYLTGALRMFFEIGEAVARFVTRLTFSPVVWAGVVVLGVAVVLLLVAGVLDRRGVGRRPRKDGAAGSGEETGRTRRGRKAVPAPGRGDAGEDADPELDDIESLLRKHGIS